MFGLLRSGWTEHYIDGGCVHCPRRGRDVEVDVCSGCAWFEAIDLRANPPYVRCRGEPAPLRLPLY